MPENNFNNTLYYAKMLLSKLWKTQETYNRMAELMIAPV
jgi:hypothetical protein